MVAFLKLYPHTCVRHFRRNGGITVIRSGDGDFDTEKEEKEPLNSSPCSDRTWWAFYFYLFNNFFTESSPTIESQASGRQLLSD